MGTFLLHVMIHLHFRFAADELANVNGIILEIPNVTNAELMMCVSFDSSTSSVRIIVLAHLFGDPQKLLAYYLNMTNCTAAPDPGKYIVGVFIHNVGSTLKAPATSPNVSVFTSEYFFIDYNNSMI